MLGVMKVLYLLDRPELCGRVKVVFQHAALLRRHGHEVSIAGLGRLRAKHLLIGLAITAALSQTGCMLVGTVGQEILSQVESKKRMRCFESGRHGFHLPDDPKAGSIEFLSCVSAENDCVLEGLSPEEIESFELIGTDMFTDNLARTNRRIYRRCTPLRISEPTSSLLRELEAEYSADDIEEALLTCPAQFRVISTDRISSGRLWTDGEFLYLRREPIPVGVKRHREVIRNRIENGCPSADQTLPYSEGEPDRLPFHPSCNLPYKLDESGAFSNYWTLNGEYFFYSCRVQTEGPLVLLDYRFAVDDHHVYFDGQRVPGADRTTFEVTSPTRAYFTGTQARDAVRVYASTETRAPQNGLLCDGELCLLHGECDKID
jgi:hypothetical protein